MATVPDFGALASQQAAANNAATDKTNLANRSNQTGPMGSLTWTQGPNGQWTQGVGLSGGAQGLFDQTIAGQSGMAGEIGQGVNFGSLPAMPDSGFGASQQVIDAWNALQQPGLQKSADAARARAAAMGLTIGSNASNDIENTIGTNEATSRNQGILQGTQEYGNVFNRGLQARQQAEKEATDRYQSLLSGSASLGSTRDSLNPNKWLGQTTPSAAYLPEQIYSAGLDTFSANQAKENAAQAQSNANRSASSGLINTGVNAVSALGGIGGITGGIKDIWSMFGSGNQGISDVYNYSDPTWGGAWGGQQLTNGGGYSAPSYFGDSAWGSNLPANVWNFGNAGDT